MIAAHFLKTFFPASAVDRRLTDPQNHANRPGIFTMGRIALSCNTSHRFVTDCVPHGFSNDR